MTPTANDELRRRAMEAENGEWISAGARIVHIRAAVEGGRAVNVDLSRVPEGNRGVSIQQINELVQKYEATQVSPPIGEMR